MWRFLGVSEYCGDESQQKKRPRRSCLRQLADAKSLIKTLLSSPLPILACSGILEYWSTGKRRLLGGYTVVGVLFGHGIMDFRIPVSSDRRNNDS